MATPIPRNRAPLSVWSAAAATGGTIVHARPEGATSIGITSDSRAVTPGCAFVALPGERFDGHDFVLGAIHAGAGLVVVQRGRAPMTTQADVVEVDDTLVAWGALARAHLRAWRRARFGQAPARVIGITGSAGKTTTKELCKALLGALGPCHATLGNLNNRIGVPAVAFGVEPQHRFLVLEMGMSERGEIAALADIAEPDVGLVTNVGVAHAEGVGGGRADVAREKGALYAALARDGIAIVNDDDEAAKGELARAVTLRVESFGTGEGARYRLVRRAPLGPAGASLVIARPGRAEIEAKLPLFGAAAAIDFVAALAATEAVSGESLPVEHWGTALTGFRAGPGRLHVRPLSDGTVVLDDTYNANPASMRAAFETLRELASDGRRAVVVLGEMKELGTVTAAEHSALGPALAHAGVALAVGCGGAIDLTLDAAERAGVAVLRGASTDDAARLARAHVKPGDVVLAKGSRSVAVERIVEALVHAHGGERAAGEG